MASVQIEIITIFNIFVWRLQTEGANFQLAPPYSVKELGNVAV